MQSKAGTLHDGVSPCRLERLCKARGVSWRISHWHGEGVGDADNEQDQQQAKAGKDRSIGKVLITSKQASRVEAAKQQNGKLQKQQQQKKLSAKVTAPSSAVKEEPKESTAAAQPAAPAPPPAQEEQPTFRGPLKAAFKHWKAKEQQGGCGSGSGCV